MFASNQPNSNQFGETPRELLIGACIRNHIGFTPVVSKFDECVALLPSELTAQARNAAVQSLAAIFTNFIETGNWKALQEMPFERGLEGAEVGARLQVAELVSELLVIARISNRDEILREHVAFSCLNDIFSSPLIPSTNSISELEIFVKSAPAFIDRVIEFERSRQALPVHQGLGPSDIRFLYRADEIVVSNLRLLIENNMPADVCAKISEAFIRIEKQSLRDEVVDMWKWFAHSSMCSSLVDENRLPEPVGRPALLGAIKTHHFPGGRFNLGGPQVVHQFPVSLPDSPHPWRYFAQRLTSLGKVKDPDSRDLRIGAYVVSFREFLASQPFYKREEQLFREVNLFGRGSKEARAFYSEVYGIDSPPGPEGSWIVEKPLRETAQAFRFMAAARFGLNLRKGYTRTLQDSNKWLLEHMAEELKGESARYRYKDIEAYPGSGARMWGLDIRNAVDLSTSETRRRWLKMCPWIAASLRVGGEVEYHFTRGFKAIARTLDAAAHPLSKEWERKGSYDGEPYTALIFNDHFHNDLLPEVRMWLVPERVFHRKIVWAIENGVDINTLDLTPEGLAEEADALQLTIFDVGASCCRWASFANAWPHGRGPAFRWENYNDWAYSKWQSPRHIHRGLAGERYSEILTVPVGEAMVAARVEHDKINHMVNFFLDLHSSFLSMEEAWAKGYANVDEAPAKEEPPPPRDLDGAPSSGPRSDGSTQDAREEFDFAPQRLRNRMLDHFLELRNQLLESKSRRGDRSSKGLDIRLELQYTRLFVRQEGTPYLSGADMMLVFPDGKRVALLGGRHQPGELVTQRVERNERMEALWDRHIVSHFAPNNCPRIIYP